jgi:hypothetical protein
MRGDPHHIRLLRLPWHPVFPFKESLRTHSSIRLNGSVRRFIERLDVIEVFRDVKPPRLEKISEGVGFKKPVAVDMAVLKDGFVNSFVASVSRASSDDHHSVRVVGLKFFETIREIVGKTDFDTGRVFTPNKVNHALK